MLRCQLHVVLRHVAPDLPLTTTATGCDRCKENHFMADIDSVGAPESLENIYKRRFGPDVEFRQRMWRVLCKSYFQRYVSASATVLEVGAGYCEFINNIKAGRK